MGGIGCGPRALGILDGISGYPLSNGIEFRASRVQTHSLSPLKPGGDTYRRPLLLYWLAARGSKGLRYLASIILGFIRLPNFQ